jgi:phytoene dehydrogenase-like protein
MSYTAYAAASTTGTSVVVGAAVVVGTVVVVVDVVDVVVVVVVVVVVDVVVVDVGRDAGDVVGSAASSPVHAATSATTTQPDTIRRRTMCPDGTAATPRSVRFPAMAGTTEYDAVVVGAGPNGLVAAITMAEAGRTVVVFEAGPTPGGGCRTAELTEPGFRHDVCSAIHALGTASAALRELPLEQHGVRWRHPKIPLAHPLDGGAALLHRSLDDTVAGLGADGATWRRLMTPLVDGGLPVIDDLLTPLSLPRHPLRLARFGLDAVRPATSVGRRRFDGDRGAAMFAGLAAHSILALDRPLTTGVGLVLGSLAHIVGWPCAEGGSQAITDALVSILRSHGGDVVCDHRVGDLGDLPSSTVVLADVTPRQLIAMAGDRFPQRARKRFGSFRHGAGVFKLDYALSEPVPWADPAVAGAGTVHVGGTLAEVAAAEAAVAKGQHPEAPFVLVAQQSLFDDRRAPAGRHTLWTYCHVPAGSTVDMTSRIEAQIERFAPGFGDVVLARHAMTTGDFEAYNASYIGGDIAGGVTDWRQFATRPVISPKPWRTPVPGVYLCSASTPPGAGVHGLCGRAAARLALHEHP